MTEAWIAGDPAGWWADEWVFDCGEYLGPGDYAAPPFLPASADLVAFTLGFPNPDNDIQHFNDGSYTSDWRNKYRTTGGSTGTTGSAFGGTGGRHLYAVWVPAGSPSDLTGTDPDILPLDLVPAAYVVGGRYHSGAGSATVGAPSFALSETGATGSGDALAILLASVVSYDSTDRVLSPLAGPIGSITTDPRPTLALYTADGGFKITNIRRARDVVYQEQLSEPGSLSFSLALNDPITADLTPGRIVKVIWRGQARFAARIDRHSTDVAVDGNVWRRWDSLPGVLDMLNDGVIMPEYGLRPTSGTVRNFGPMSHFGAWYDSGHWETAVGIFYDDDTGYRKGKPAKLHTANPKWISKTGAYHIEDAGTTFWFRKTFYTSTVPMTYRVLAAADMHLTLYVDGEEVFTPDQQESHSWRFLATIPGTFTLDPGRHVIAAKVQNSRLKDSPLAFLCLVQQTDVKGDPVPGPALIRTDDHWTVSTVDPGWNPGEIVAGMMFEAREYPVPALSTIGRTFSSDVDSHGVAWDDPGIYAFDIGTGICDLTQQLAESKFSAWVNPETLTLGLYQRQGVDRSADVVFDLGVKQQVVERIAPRFNSAIVQRRDGTWAIIEDSSSVSGDGRAMIGLSIGSTPDDNTASKVARSQFRETANDRYVFTAEVSSLAGPQVYLDWHLGDTVSVPSESGSGYTKARVMAITVDATGETVKVVPELMKDTS